jgi:hypothetical protein
MRNKRRARRRGPCQLFELLITLLALPAIGRAADDMPITFHADFRGKPVPADLQRFNVEEENLLAEEPGGLHINLPKTFKHKWGGVGLRSGFGVKGDFDMTLAFEILHFEVPPSGYGAGVGLFIYTRGVHSGVCRLVKNDGVPVVSWEVNGDNNRQGKRAAEEMSGRLRLQRTGTTLSFLWAPAIEGGSFQEIQHVELGSDEVEKIRLVALNGQTKTPVDARLLEFTIRSGSGAPPAFTAAKGGVSIALLAGLGITLALLFGVGTWLYVRTRGQAEDSAQETP